jgi:hypothetical protein
MTNSRKEVLFLREILELFPSLTAKGHARHRRTIMARVAKSLSSRNAIVAEEAARVLHRAKEEMALRPRRKTPIPEALVKAIKGARSHWNDEVRKHVAWLSFLVKPGPCDQPEQSNNDRSKVWAYVWNTAVKLHQQDAPEISVKRLQ